MQMNVFSFKVVTYFGDISLLKTILSSSIRIFCGIVSVNAFFFLARSVALIVK